MQQYRKNLGKVSLTAEGVWDIKSKYDVLSIVYDENTQHGFISKKPVPIGVDLYNSEYWMPLNVSGYTDSNIIILNKKTSETNIESYTLEEAVKSIASVGRKPGCILGFYNSNINRLDIGGRWEIWQFNSNTISEWEDLNNWQNIYYNYNQFVGWYRNEEQLKINNPYPEIGCYAYVGNVLNEAVVYRCEIKHKWTETIQHAWDYIKVMIDGTVTVGENGNWYNNGEDTGIPANIKGDPGISPFIRYNTIKNKLEYSYDKNVWYECSDYISTWFRWNATSGDAQANNVGRIQISHDKVNWISLSGDIVNNLHISRYIGVDETLPTSGIAEGTIYAKGPYYAEGDTLNNNPIYRLWVYGWKGDTLAWQDNGEFTSIAAGVVQEIGDSETEVMSQKAVTDTIFDTKSKIIEEIPFYPLETGVWYRLKGSNSNIYKVKYGDVITIKPNLENFSLYTLLKTYNRPAFSDNVEVCEGFDYQNSINEVTSFVVPADANYLVIVNEITADDSVIYTPESLTINGVEMISNVTEKIISTNNRIDNLIKDYTGEIDYYPLETGVWWSVIGSKSHVYKVNSEDKVRIIPNTNSFAIVCYLKSYNKPKQSGETLDLCANTVPQTSIYTEQMLQIPSDCNYIVVVDDIVPDDGVTYTPLSLIINDLDVILNRGFTDNILSVTNKSPYTVVPFYPLETGVWWNIIGHNSKSTIIPISPLSKLHIKPNNEAQSEITFLKSYKYPVTNEKYDVCDGINFRISIFEEQDVTIPVDAKYLVICNEITNQDSQKYTPNEVLIDGVNILDKPGNVLLNFHNKALKDKSNINIVCMGDSLTEFGLYADGTPATGHGIPDETKGYPEILGELLNCNVTNIGMGGTRWCARKQDITSVNSVEDAYAVLDCQTFVDCLLDKNYELINSAVNYLNNNGLDNNIVQAEKAKTIEWDKVDMLVMFYGANDPNDKIGQVEDYNNDTMCGAINYVIGRLLRNYPKLKICIVAPFRMDVENSEIEGKSQKIIDVANKNACPSLNLYTSGIFNKWNHNYYFTHPTTGFYDGTHPWNGFDIYAKRIGGFIKSMM